jgi:hypothetical protein
MRAAGEARGRVAKAIGISVPTLRRTLREEGLDDGWRGSGRRALPPKTEHEIRAEFPGIGVLPDSAIAARAGCSRQHIAKVRLAAGIPAAGAEPSN